MSTVRWLIDDIREKMVATPSNIHIPVYKVHRSKGLEADVVFILELENQLPNRIMLQLLGLKKQFGRFMCF